MRVSTVGPEAGSADTSRDVHGWAMKLYTDEGNLDWVFNNTVGEIQGRKKKQSCFLFDFSRFSSFGIPSNFLP